MTVLEEKLKKAKRMNGIRANFYLKESALMSAEMCSPALLLCTSSVSEITTLSEILAAQTLDLLCQTGILVGSTLEWKP